MLRVRVTGPAKVTRTSTFLVAGLMVVAGEAACSEALYGGPGDRVSPPVEAGPSATEVGPPMRQDAAVACYDPAPERLLGTAAPAHREACTSDDLQEVERLCFTNPHTSTACTDWRAAHAPCGACVFGAGPATGPIGAMIPAGPGLLQPNLASCAAFVIGRPECALPAAKASACLTGACARCATVGERTTCRDYAGKNECRDLVDTDCQKAIDDGIGRWDSVCRGATPGATFAKVAFYLCGALPGGSDAATD